MLDLVLNTSLDRVRVPKDVQVLDPLRGEQAVEVRRIVELFHRRYFTDDRPRLLMLGINPGRLGAGSTGLCFTDTKRCESDLGIPVQGIRTHEPSSDFFYRVVRAMGGAEAFYRDVYVQAICPLGFTRTGPKGAPVNLNYYDDPALQRAITPFVVDWLHALIATGMRRDTVLCIGTGKNLAYLERINAEHGFFERIVPLEHPRFIMQYRAKQLDAYVQKYAQLLAASFKPQATGLLP
ncbi:MAG TPA: uracil-DNA glycosylase family protein [Flavobacteriales bacterium]|nr:uracil-DNA glycosylase family protein [Flavobacteriales bacterium]